MRSFKLSLRTIKKSLIKKSLNQFLKTLSSGNFDQCGTQLARTFAYKDPIG